MLISKLYIYSAYKNKGNESNDWKLLDVEPSDIENYLTNYWEKRGYREEYLLKEHVGRISKIYTNGKYKILLYNIKAEKFSTFTQSAKTFNVIF